MSKLQLVTSAVAISAVLSGIGIAACGGGTATQTNPDGGASSSSSSSGSSGSGSDAANAGGLPDIDKPLIPASKVDLLLVVDNSFSMADKSKALAASIGTLVNQVTKTGDVHVGVISSSLGSLGGDVCPNTGDFNGLAHLRTTGPGGVAVPGAATGVLSFTSGGDASAFAQSVAAVVGGVGEQGCGLEAQLEATYRFLAQPDPWQSVTLDNFNQATLSGIDNELLAERKAFLRPDSALVVVLLTDEDDSASDPMAIGGQGWAFSAKNFPGSKIFRNAGPAQGTTAPRGTTACAANPASADCTSCGFQSLCDPSTPECQKLKSDAQCTTSGQQGQSGEGYNGYYPGDEDSLNVRFHRMKERFGIDPQYPVSRYVNGLSISVVPNRDAEHIKKTAANGRVDIAAYTGIPNCTNPIFAATLPASASEELCTRDRGPRSRELVVFAVVGGIPPALANDTPNWTAILGADPDAFDYTGIDPHMIQSVSPRQNLQGPSASAGDNGSDPIHGREYDTKKNDLQYACTFDLAAPKTCAPGEPCDCGPDQTINPPLCNASKQQIKAKAYPTIRPLRVVKGLGDRGVVGSICSSSYETTMSSLIVRLASRLKQ